MSYVTRDCIKNPLVNVIPSEIDNEHLKTILK